MEESVRSLSQLSTSFRVCHRTPQPPETLAVPGINGSTTPVTNPDFHTWFQTDQVIKSWLVGSFSENIQSLVVSCSTSYQIWDALAKHYNRPTSSRLFELQHKLQTVAKQDRSMTDYLTDVKLICDQLASIGSPVPERMEIFPGPSRFRQGL